MNREAIRPSARDGAGGSKVGDLRALQPLTPLRAKIFLAAKGLISLLIDRFSSFGGGIGGSEMGLIFSRRPT
jgi:hypothetical protein